MHRGARTIAIMGALSSLMGSLSGAGLNRANRIAIGDDITITHSTPASYARRSGNRVKRHFTRERSFNRLAHGKKTRLKHVRKAQRT